MDDNDEHESFEINDTDFEYAMNPGRRHFQSKEQATYGVWADEDSDEDTRKAPSKKKGKYDMPIGFVSGGIQKGTKIDKDDPSSLELGKSSVRDKDDEAIEINFSQRTKKKPKEMGAQVFAGMRSSATQGSVDPNKYCDWMKHGNGSVIMKMMQSMGYKHGAGLGASEQGIVEPVQAALRKGRGAVGAYGKEMTGPKFGESAADAQKRLAGKPGEEENETPKVTVKGGWKKAQTVKTKYRTIEDVLQQGSSAISTSKLSSEHSQTKVIDMTGPQQRVYSGYDSFSLKTRSEYEIDTESREVFDVPELLHNLNLLVDLTEESIRRNNQQCIVLKDQNTALEYDLKQIRLAKEDEELEEKRMKQVYELIDGFSKTPSMLECQELLQRLKTEFPNEYRIYNLESVAIPLVLPLIRKFFNEWRPLDREHVIYGVELMREWKDILTADGMKHTFGMNKSNFDEIAAYDRLMWEGWLPALRRASLSWDPRDEMNEMIELIETWIPLLPIWIKENILEQLIVPRISDRVNEWDPTQDMVPIHSWLIPWLVLLGDRIQIVMPSIRQKLQKALRLWNPMDRSAMGILKPWKDIWSPGTFNAFLAQNIVPKLGQTLHEMDLDPRTNPNYPEWKAVIDWLEFVHPDAIASAVSKYFFPRLFDVLCRWLDSPNSVMMEIKRWYGEWKSKIPAEISMYPSVNEGLRQCLIVIGKSMQGARVSNLSLPSMVPTQRGPPQPNVPMMPVTQQLSLKDMIEITAAKHGFTYHPQKDRFKDGRQVFWFGSVSIYLDSGMVYVMDPVEFIWRPSGIEELIRLGQGGS